jgi:hypothetical protein
VTPGETFTVEIDPDAKEYENAPDIDSITIVRTEDGEAVEEVEATPVDGSDTYEAELTAPSEESEIRLLTNVLGEESVAYTSEQEILGFTDTSLTESAFGVTIDEDASTTEVAENETVEVVADVENTGDFTGQETVKLLRDGDTVDDVTVSLNGSEGDVVTLTHDTGDGDAGEVGYTVSSPDGSDSLNVTVTEPDETDGTDGGEAVDGPENDSDTDGSDDGTTGGGATDGSGDSATDNGSVDDEADTDDGVSGNGTDDGGSDGTNDQDQSENGSDTDDNGDTSNDSGTADSSDSTSDSEQGSDSSGGTDAIEPTEEEASPVSVPLTGVPQFLAAVLVIGLLARSRKG